MSKSAEDSYILALDLNVWEILTIWIFDLRKVVQGQEYTFLNDTIAGKCKNPQKICVHHCANLQKTCSTFCINFQRFRDINLKFLP